MISRLKSLSLRLPSDFILIPLSMVIANVSIIMTSAHDSGLPAGLVIISLPIILVAAGLLAITGGRIFNLLEDSKSEAPPHVVISLSLSIILSAVISLMAHTEVGTIVAAIHGGQILFSIVVILSSLIEKTDDSKADATNAEASESPASAG